VRPTSAIERSTRFILPATQHPAKLLLDATRQHVTGLIANPLVK
jgi:hypothetical protein